MSAARIVRAVDVLGGLILAPSLLVAVDGLLVGSRARSRLAR